MNDSESMTDAFPLQVIVIGLHDHPGAVNSVSEVFSGRGLQMEAFHGTANSLNPDGHAQALIVFRASPERAAFVTRVIQRLSSVRSARLLAADDPRLVQSVLVERAEVLPSAGIGVVPLGAQTALAVGSPAAMYAWLASAEASRRLGAVRLDLLCGEPERAPQKAPPRSCSAR